MPHFFINSNQITNKEITISDKENYQHIARSLRARAGEKLLLIDEQQIQYETTIMSISGSKIVAEINKSYPSKRFLDKINADEELKARAKIVVERKDVIYELEPDVNIYKINE